MCFSSLLPPMPCAVLQSPHLSLLTVHRKGGNSSPLPSVVNPCQQQLGQRWQERPVSAPWGFSCGAGQQPGAWGKGVSRALV